MDKTVAIVLGGGKGTRLYPLTKERAKPAVPFGGKYRLVDIPISNCINSNLKKIYVLTQFNTASLHNHISNTYIFDVFTKGFVEILAAEQTFETTSWYEGTADAVRKNMYHFRGQIPDYYVILSGDQLYRMDIEDMINNHKKSGAEVTIASTPVTRLDAEGLGIVRCDKTGKAISFLEKPASDVDISDLKFDQILVEGKENVDPKKEYMASMGIYVFNAKAMEELLDNNLVDFGKDILPMAIKDKHINVYPFTGFWEDIGTIKAFFESNLDIASLTPKFNFYDEDRPIFTHRRHLPATKMNFCTVSQSLAAEGSIITNASIVNTIIGIRTIIESGANLDSVYSMGATYYETESQKKNNKKQGRPNLGIGRGSMIKRAIIDVNARIGDGCRIGVDQKEREDGEYGNYWIVDGIIIISKKGIIPAGTNI